MGPKVETEAILRHALGENVTDEKQKEKGNERKGEIMRTIHYRGGILPEIPVDIVDDAIQGRVKVFFHDQLLIGKLTKAEMTAYDQARTRHTLIISKSSGSLENAYFQWCENYNEPYIVVREKRKYAQVKYDLITTRDAKGFCSHLPRPLVEKIANVLSQASRGEWSAGGQYTYAHRVEIIQAPTLAKELYKIWEEYRDSGAPHVRA